MHGSGGSAVSAYSAHREWASRPPDERYQSVQALYDAARARRDRTEERHLVTGDFRTEAVASDAIAIRDASGRQAALPTGASSSSPAWPARRRSTSARCPRRSRLTRSTTGCAASVATNTRSSPTTLTRGPCTRSRHRGTHASTMTSWPPGCSASWPCHIGASIQEAWTLSLQTVQAALDADTANDRTMLLRTTSRELGPTREAVVDTAVQRLELSQKQANEAYTLAEQPGIEWPALCDPRRGPRGAAAATRRRARDVLDHVQRANMGRRHCGAGDAGGDLHTAVRARLGLPRDSRRRLRPMEHVRRLQGPLHQGTQRRRRRVL